MEAIRYETLVRRAFGFKSGGHTIDRWADTARLADTDKFCEKRLPSVKVGAGYAFEILTTEILNSKGESLEEGEYKRLQDFTGRVVAATDLVEAGQIINDFIETVENKYFRFDDGVMSLK